MSARQILQRILGRKPAKPQPRPRYIDTAYGSHDRLRDLSDADRAAQLAQLQAIPMSDGRQSS